MSREAPFLTIVETSQFEDIDDFVINGGLINTRKRYALNYIIIDAGIAATMDVIYGKKTMPKKLKASPKEADKSELSGLPEDIVNE